MNKTNQVLDIVWKLIVIEKYQCWKNCFLKQIKQKEYHSTNNQFFILKFSTNMWLLHVFYNNLINLFKMLWKLRC
jgi:hypothetical protein